MRKGEEWGAEQLPLVMRDVCADSVLAAGESTGPLRALPIYPFARQIYAIALYLPSLTSSESNL